MDNLQDAIIKLRSSGLKSTRQRVRILEILLETGQPVTAERIYADMITDESPFSLSTIYRAMDSLAEKGIINKVTFENESRTYYEINREIHHHFLVCLACNKIYTIDSCPLHDYEDQVADTMGFKVVGHKLELYGYCTSCQKKHNQIPN